MRLKIPSKTIWVPVLMLVLGFVSGITVGFFAERNRAAQANAEWLHRLQLSHASLDAVYFTELLETAQAGKVDALEARLETNLDFSLIDIAREYTPKRDMQGGGATALAKAREYRTVHPHQAGLTDVATASRIGPGHPRPHHRLLHGSPTTAGSDWCTG